MRVFASRDAIVAVCRPLPARHRPKNNFQVCRLSLRERSGFRGAKGNTIGTMRIGLVLEEFDPSSGGLAQWTWQFCSHLLRRGHEVHVVARRFAPFADAADIVRHPVEPSAKRLRFAQAAEATLRTLPLDVIHDMGAGWHCDVFQPHGGSWASVTGRKLLLHDPWVRPLKRWVDRLLPRHREFQQLLRRQYSTRGQVFVAISQTVADDFRRLHGVPDEAIRLIYNGVDTDRFSPAHRATHRGATRSRLGLDDRTVVALAVAHNFRLKGIPALLGAVRHLVQQRLPSHLVVVGGKHLAGWQRKAGFLGIQHAVTFVGSVDDTVPYYSAADLFVHPTFYDPCSLVLLEAAASGLPIITTRCANGAAELLTDGADALLVSRPGDAQELAGKMQMLLDDRRRLELGSAARSLAIQHTFHRNVEEMLSLYRERTERRRRAA